MHDWGHQLNSADVERGLRDLNPGFHFDMGTALGQVHPYQATRQGVFFDGRHICSMDRGTIPEFKVWNVAETLVPVSLGEADQGDCSIRYMTITPDTPGYEDLCSEAMRGQRDDLTLNADGKLCRIQAVRTVKVRGRVVLVGWRHTFERIIMKNIEGATRPNIGAKFNVDMFKIPVGSPEETWAMLVEE